MVYTGKLFGFVEFFEIFQEYSRNMRIFNVHPGTFSTFQEYAWYIVCCTGEGCNMVLLISVHLFRNGYHKAVLL